MTTVKKYPVNPDLRLVRRLDFLRERGPVWNRGPELGLVEGDVIRAHGVARGWAERELVATPHWATANNPDAYLRDFWGCVWNGQPNTALVKREAEVAQQQVERNRQAVLVRAKYGPPGEYARKTFSDFDACSPERAAVLAAAQAFPYAGPYYNGFWDGDYGEERYRNLILNGPVGTGKTLLACAVLEDRGEFITHNELVRKFTARGADVGALLRRYGDGQGDHSDPLDPFHPRHGAGTWLVIDDFAMSWDFEIAGFVTEILDRRSAHDHVTIITSNLPTGKLKELVGPRASSRLFGKALVLAVGGRDYRMECTP
jgi:DNA replication protein DnaC